MCMAKWKHLEKNLVSMMATAAFILSAAAASSVIVLAQEAIVIPQEDIVEDRETDAPEKAEEGEGQLPVTMVACSLEGFHEEAAGEAVPVSIAEAGKESAAEAEETDVILQMDITGEANTALKKIQIAEQEEALMGNAAGYINVGNEIQAAAPPVIQLSGDYASNEQALWDFCKALGFTDAGAAAVLGNLSMESGLNPASRSANFNYAKGTGGAGLAGWMSRGRFRGLMKFAVENNIPWQDLSLQMSYLQYELENTRKMVGEEMKVQMDVDYATDYFCVYFEGCIGRSGSPSIDGVSVINGKWYQGLSKRKALAKAYYRKYAK